MWNLLVVEDETIVRIGLRYMLDWDRLGIMWKSEASNGHEALKALAQEDIHIVMTDIRMPGMDGLELARTIKERYGRVQIIFFSSFEDFPYVKEAVRIGVVDYLHKPTMAAEEIAAALRKAAANLEQFKVEVPPKMDPQQERDRLLHLMLVQGQELPVHWEAQWHRLGLEELYGQGYQLVVLRIAGEGTAEKQPGLARFMSFRYFLEEYISREGSGIVLNREHRELIWLLPRSVHEAGERDLQRYLDQMEQGLLDMLNVRLTYTLSKVHLAADELGTAYREADEQEPVNAGRYSGIVRMAAAYIEAHLLEDVTLSRTAEHIHVSVSHLSRLFLKETGQHFSEYITGKKMALARRLLRESNRKVYEVAEELGYANPHYFSKLFKDDTGMTPLEYRNQ